MKRKRPGISRFKSSDAGAAMTSDKKPMTPKELSFDKTLSGGDDVSMSDSFRGGRDWFKKKLKGASRRMASRG